MLTDEQRADGWIDHDGGPCPVDGEAKVFSKYRSGCVLDAQAIEAKWLENWGRWQWKETPYEGWGENIIAYRLETPDAQ